MNNYSLKLDKVTKIFGRRLIFNEIDFEFYPGKIYGLAGQNGSGKSTLSKIISGIISPTKGKVNHMLDNKIIPSEKLHDIIGFVSPYLVLYDEFTAEENLVHFAKIRGAVYNETQADKLFGDFNLFDRKNDLLKTYSSGMKQRMKYLFALLHNPYLLLLDEPTSNLDKAGKDKVYEIIRDESKSKCIIIASNESSDLELCGEIIQIENYK
ncbi:MAG: ABC transporter ATP-binding protein [Melioribacteraceae bacterium]|nr:ABC transporter ATP-binding protein [Melioribacteraceae bacterium]MCO6474240.1 ABC transporter ATP-binding protein [Melioribacteraceae bacterium]MDD3558139.1 ABC transporter ATP-binding protein [Melioribacteraceae bacterium]